MGKRWGKFKDEWKASQDALDAAEARRAKQKAKASGGSCKTTRCANDAQRDGYCPNCWTAIFG